MEINMLVCVPVLGWNMIEEADNPCITKAQFKEST